jgi:hypothetical protein
MAACRERIAPMVIPDASMRIPAGQARECSADEDG